MGEGLPSVSVSGDYRAQFRTRGTRCTGPTRSTRWCACRSSRAGACTAASLQADAELKQQQAQLADLRARIEYEVRSALLDLQAADERVRVARSAADLAGQQLAQAQDRFTAGVTSNLEVVQAQEAVATATDNYLSALYAHNLAKISLARAIGLAEERGRQLLGARSDGGPNGCRTGSDTMSEPSQAGRRATSRPRNGVSGFLRERPQARRVGLSSSACWSSSRLVAAWWYYARPRDDRRCAGRRTHRAHRRARRRHGGRREGPGQPGRRGRGGARRDRSRATTGRARQRAEADYADAQAALAAARGGHPDHLDDDGQPGQFGRGERRAGASRGPRRPLGTPRRRARGSASAQARLREATANATRTARDLERMKPLIAKDEVSQQQYDAAVAGRGRRAGGGRVRPGDRHRGRRRRWRWPRAGARRRPAP